MIVSLDHVTKEEIAAVGGKGANLGEIYRIGLPVPTGFIVSTRGYRHFVEANRLQAQIMALVANLQAGNSASYLAASTQIADLFRVGTMPDDLVDAILDAYSTLASVSTEEKERAVAVRSSATAEDLPQASFAGQQDTLLNVRGSEALLAAVKECWASLWTARAIAYRKRMGIDAGAVTIAVIVQTMIPAELSGVLFTANPTTGVRDEFVVNAGFGLGEAIVSGLVTPDTYVLDRDTGNIKEMVRGAKEIMSVPAEGQGTTTVAVPEAQQGESALSPGQLAELVGIGVQVEKHFGGVPQDIEWTVVDGRFWLLQARPITTLPPAPLRDVRWEPPRPGTVWMRRQVVEHMPNPLSPLFSELYLEVGLDQSLQESAVFIGEMAGVKIDMWEFIKPPFATTVNGYAYSIASFDLDWRLVPLIVRLYTVALPHMIRHMIPHWRDTALPAYRATIEHWKAVDPINASDEELLQGVRALAIADAIYWFAAAIPLGLARITDALLESFLKSVADNRGLPYSLHSSSGPYLRGFPSKTLDAQSDLEVIARQIRSSSDLGKQIDDAPASQLLDILGTNPGGQPALEGIQHYLDTYGHQIYDLDFVTPTMADDPLPVLLSLKAAVAHPERDARAHQAALAQERDALTTHTARSLNPIQRWLFRLLLGWAQRYSPYREEALFYVGAAWPTLRRLALTLGQRLTEIGSLNTPADVFFLESAELTAASTARANGEARLDLAELARERRVLRDARKRLAPPLSVPPNAPLKFGPIRLSQFEPQPPRESEGSILNGFAVSPGQVTATASVIHSPEEFDKMTPDTILVCTTTTPAWTPLFAQAKGLVTDIGGALAHGSIVAREYGIPAVMGTGVATQRIAHGQRIRVDGNTGIVMLLDEAETRAEHGGDTHTVKPSTSSNIKKAWSITLIVLAAGLILLWKRRKGSP